MKRTLVVSVAASALLLAMNASAADGGTAKPKSKQSLIVFDIVPENGVTQGTANLLTEVVIDNVGKLDRFKVIGQKDISKIMNIEQTKQMAGCSDSGCLANIAGSMGSDFYIEGSVGSVGDKYIVTLKLMDAQKVETVEHNTRIIPKDDNLILDAVVSLVAALFKLQTPPAAGGPQASGAAIIESIAHLTVEVEPADAQLTVTGPGGAMYSVSGRFDKRNLKTGEYKVRASAPGYGADERVLVLKGEKDVSDRLVLQKAGGLDISGEPVGAKVEIAGPCDFKTEQGLPMTVTGLRYGKYSVKVSRDGFITIAKEVEVKPGETSKVDVRMKKGSLKTDGEMDQYGLEWVELPAGVFRMGCSSREGQSCFKQEFPVHKVKLSGFRMTKSEVTQGQFKSIMGSNPSRFAECGAQCPVESVTWEDASQFCRKVGGRLPTEAEWEYAARAGSDEGAYAERDKIAWFKNNSDGSPHPVKMKAPNKNGLDDMLGNVMEWTADWFSDSYYQESPAENPRGPEKGEMRVVRGGAYSMDPKLIRASFRYRLAPGSASETVGFRCAL